MTRTSSSPTSSLGEAQSPRTGEFHPRVLVVDDEVVIADTITKIYGLNGYAATAAYDGDTAFRQTGYNECNFKFWAVEMLFSFGVLLLAIGLFWMRVLFSHQRIGLSEFADRKDSRRDKYKPDDVPSSG